MQVIMGMPTVTEVGVEVTTGTEEAPIAVVPDAALVVAAEVVVVVAEAGVGVVDVVEGDANMVETGSC